MKIKSYTLLFRIFSYLSDKTNGASFFVRYKLMLGTLIIGLTGSVANVKAQKKDSSYTGNDTIILPKAQVTCYKVYIPPEEDQKGEVEAKGNVTDPSGEPVIGVTVVVKNTRNGTVTDAKGNFILKKVKQSDILVFSYIGFKQQEVALPKVRANDIKVVMQEDEMILCYEVVIISLPDNDDIYRRTPKRITKFSYEEAQTPPVSRVGNLPAFEDWVNDEVRYNDEMLKDKIEGEVVASFAIDKKGNIKDAKITRKLHPYADAEVLRLLSTSGKWTPGEHNGKKIKTTMTITVKFILPENK
ncbi:TonB family protein [Dysgonomonas hofstadii]|uniref:TonB family protein n=1 Tax=Dysgonomonas hofstadii TaxID=637886 RepID=A0A840CLI7_9BACT|nr:TonB family protein [Dysgonomonas hofstadii]MBB4036927.1 TonB family protein [Dysgonomonas hofstadii]